MFNQAKSLLSIRRMREVASFLYLQRVKGFTPPSDPHFDADTRAFFERELAKARTYLEYGSGGSTLLADRQNIRTLTVEGDRFYAKLVRAALSCHTSVKIITPRMGVTVEWSMPLFHSRRKACRYVNAPFTGNEKAFPDLILVDGRYRIACALEVARRARISATKATLIFDDYFDRPQYNAIEQKLGHPRRIGRAAIFKIGTQQVGTADVEPFLTHSL